MNAAFSPDGTRVVTASEDRTARFWDATTGKQLAPALEHQGWVSSAAFSPDGTRVVTASADQTAQVWDAATGKPLTPALEHRGEVWSAAFSPDGTRLITASKDMTAQVWKTGLDETPCPAWLALAARNPFVLIGSVHDLRDPVLEVLNGPPTITCP